MSGVTYHGEYPEGQVDGDGNRYIDHQGFRFVEGKATTVTDKDALKKLAGNRFFKTPDTDKEQLEQGQEEAEKAELQTLQGYLKTENVPFHHKAGLKTLRDLKAQHEDAKLKAQEA